MECENLSLLGFASSFHAGDKRHLKAAAQSHLFLLPCEAFFIDLN
jgi:hypothetical protein